MEVAAGPHHTTQLTCCRAVRRLQPGRQDVAQRGVCRQVEAVLLETFRTKLVTYSSC